MKMPPVDGQWLDLYALLDVPVDCDVETLRKRIGKVYSESAANSDHRQLERRHYFQSMIERVLPQCRRVLLEPEWRAKYDVQHQLHLDNEPSAQTYVAFIASMRGQNVVPTGDDLLPLLAQEDIKVAREVVECAMQGTELDLLPSHTISHFDPVQHDPVPHNPAPPEKPQQNTAPRVPVATPVKSAVSGAVSGQATPQRAAASSTATSPANFTAADSDFEGPDFGGPNVEGSQPFSGPNRAENARPSATTSKAKAEVKADPVMRSAAFHHDPAHPAAPTIEISEHEVQASEIRASRTPKKEKGGADEIRAQVITASEAAEIRRRRASNPDSQPFTDVILAPGQTNKLRGRVSRVIVGETYKEVAQPRLISPTSMNLMVAIVGVLLTITIQRFATTPAMATSAGRMPIFLAVSSEMEPAMLRAETAWEKTPDGAPFDLVVQSADSGAGLRRALGTGGQTPDAWIPSDSLWIERYNDQAVALKRAPITANSPIAQTPMVLLARSDRAAELRRRFPGHQIPSWTALRGAVMAGAAGHLGLSDPQRSSAGALARVSMAREWGLSKGIFPAQAAKSDDFWRWMAAFEDNSSAAEPGVMVKDLILGTTGRFWWALCYESDALAALSAGKSVEIYYLPRTVLADHPFCSLERVGAPLEVAQGRANFEKFLRSEPAQKQLLNSGFRPTEVSLKTPTRSNPFLNPKFRGNGARAENLPRDERAGTRAIDALVAQWSKRFQ